jgi:3-hydroxyacyl-[acyl-carrier-protein] dehydratase
MSSEGITGNYTFKKDEYFYKGHFKNNPITPGVILTECMAQIGVVCLGIYILKDEILEEKKPQIALTSSQVDFFLPVFPGEKVTVISEKEVFRFNKLKCKVKLFNEKNELVCRGLISGMIHIPA